MGNDFLKKRKNFRDIDEGNGNGEPEPRVQGDFYLLVIAIDHYTNGFRPLNNPVKDASLLLDILTEYYTFERPAFNETHDLRKTDSRYARLNLKKPVWNYQRGEDDSIWCLYNEEANQNNIFNALYEIKAKVQKDDSVVIFFAGHGTDFSGKGRLITYDAKKKVAGQEISDHVKAREWLKVTDIVSEFDSFPCDKILLILDCCYSGAIFSKATIPIQDDDLKEEYIRFGVSSAGSAEKADDGEPGEHSPFAKLLGMELKAFNQSHLVDIKSIVAKVSANLEREQMFGASNVTQKILSGKVSDCKNGEGKFYLFRKEKEPKAETIEKFLGKLDFEEQKVEFRVPHYHQDRNDFNLVATKSTQLDEQRFLAKVLLKHMKNSCYGDREICNEFYPVTPIPIGSTEHGKMDFWEAMQKNELQTTSGKKLERGPSDAELNEPPKEIMDWVFGILKSKNLILQFDINLGMIKDSKILNNQIASFLTALNIFYQLKLKDARKQGDTLHKLFVFFTDTRDNQEVLFSDDLITELQGFTNILNTPKIEPFTLHTVSLWRNKLVDIENCPHQLKCIDMNKIQAKDYRIFDFAKELCRYFKIEQQQDDLLKIIKTINGTIQ